MPRQPYKFHAFSIRNCQQCGQEITTRRNRSFCSSKCRGIALGTSQKEQNWKPRICKNCGDEFKPLNSTRKFCEKCDEGTFRTAFTRYGLTKNQITEILKKQNNKCALCPREAKFIDHNHATGKARGMLCPACNTALGRIDEIPNWAQKALEYLKEYDSI